MVANLPLILWAVVTKISCLNSCQIAMIIEYFSTVIINLTLISKIRGPITYSSGLKRVTEKKSKRILAISDQMRYTKKACLHHRNRCAPFLKVIFAITKIAPH